MGSGRWRGRIGLGFSEHERSFVVFEDGGRVKSDIGRAAAQATKSVGGSALGLHC